MTTLPLPDSKARRARAFYEGMGRYGITPDDADSLRRIEMTLHRWHEQECGSGDSYASWAIERDDETGKPHRCVYPHNGPARRYPIADRKAGAQRRLRVIMARYPHLSAYVQSDPRGCALYVGKKEDMTDEGYTNGKAVTL